MSATSLSIVNIRKRDTQELLDRVLWPGEILLGYTKCRLNSGELFARQYAVGLTQRRFLLVRADQPERVYSIYRSCVEKLTYRGGLRLQMGGSQSAAGAAAFLPVCMGWGAYAARLVEQHTQWEQEAPYLTSAQFTQSIADLDELGLLKPAQALLDEHMVKEPIVEIDPQAIRLARRIRERGLAMRVALATFALALPFMTVMGLLGFARLGLGNVLVLVAALALLRGQLARRGFALVLALFATGINLAYCAAAGSPQEAILWFAFGTAITLLLTGESSRARTLTAGLVSTLGFTGVLVFTVVTTVSAAPAYFEDDFSANHGWPIVRQEAQVSQVINGAYQIQVKEPGSFFFAFPPISFTPQEVRFDVQVPGAFLPDSALPEEGFLGTNTYGVTCDYENSNQLYLVAIDLSGRRFAVLKQDGPRLTALTEGLWKPVTGLQANGAANRVDVRCANGEIRLTVNEMAQGQINDPGMRGTGKMGLFVFTRKNSAPGGYQALFDNVAFWREGTRGE